NKNVSVPATTASAVYIYDLDSGSVLYEKNSDERFYPASTTKLMTALTAIDIYETDQVLTIKSGKSIGNTVHLRIGNKLTVENLLNALLINSGNDAALALAENHPDGYGGFINQMNQKTVVLGLTDTRFANPSGLVNPNHYTTAKDLTIIAKEAISNALIRKIVATKQLEISDITGKLKYPLISTNQLLGFEGVKGLKTGWTPESKEVLVSFVERNGHTIIVTVLNSDDRFGESKRLIDWVYNNFTWETI
ncbi:D-alanyl-D-alanine carboxypeptidase, partial [Candidatus Collierbacteria bacterium]|nr:D-alanyl-D-alanine carboxypeptidase [Candidatus Collierbacteria bacterium]